MVNIEVFQILLYLLLLVLTGRGCYRFVNKGIKARGCLSFEIVFAAVCWQFIQGRAFVI